LPGPNQADKMLSRACCNPTKFLGIGRLGRLVSVGRARRLRPTNVPVIVEEPSRYRPSYWSAPLLPVRTVAVTPAAVSLPDFIAAVSARQKPRFWRINCQYFCVTSSAGWAVRSRGSSACDMRGASDIWTTMLARNKSKNQCGEAKRRDHATAGRAGGEGNWDE